MKLIQSIGFRSNFATASVSELPEIFPLGFERTRFVESDVEFLFKKILTDCARRTSGIKPLDERVLWDNCLGNESAKGLISLMSEAMTKQTDLYLVYKVGILRKATIDEESKIQADYEAKGQSSVGVYLGFKNFKVIEMFKVYSGLEYCVLKSLNKTTNLASAVQMKIADLRKSVGRMDAEPPITTQASDLAKAMGAGKDVLLDAGDTVETAKVDIGPSESAMSWINKRRSYYSGLPMSYIEGTQTPGIGSTGEQDARAVDNGLQPYWKAFFQPAVEALFKGTKVKYQPSDFRQVGTTLDALRTFELTTDGLISKKDKQEIIWSLLGLDFEAARKNLKDEELEAERLAREAALLIPPPANQDNQEDEDA